MDQDEWTNPTAVAVSLRRYFMVNLPPVRQIEKETQ